ncbi:MAG TPA: ribosomal protein S18-alanine N-acetyltransferase [Chthonomonadales bacterium]|nr:ribosomal protein S18-alanine N-acetyltransferase [Chthonomonadales bacterium]
MAISLEPVSIEPMRRGDLEAVTRIDRLCFPVPWSPSSYVTELANRTARYLVARIAGQLVGYAGAWVIMDEAHITTLAVDPQYQRRKVGERLLIALLEEAALQKASRATLEVRESNAAAQNLYRRYGFRSVAVRRSYYTDNGENALVMWSEGIHTLQYRTFLREQRRKMVAANPTARRRWPW